MFLLIIPAALKISLLLIGVVCAGVAGLILYRLILRPAFEARADIDSPPPEEGFTYEIVLEQERFRTISVGQMDSDINTRLSGIKEDHAELRFERDRDTEDYTIAFEAGGAVFWRPPHAKKIEGLKGTELFESRELIGHPMMFRIAANVKDGRALQYVEFELSTDYFINRFGEEKMRFTLTLNRVYPSVDRDSRDKKGVFNFGRLQQASDSGDEAAAEAEEGEDSLG